MSDFDELARRRRGESEDRLRAKSAALAQAATEAEQAIQTAIDFLEARVSPILEEAKASLEKIGAPATLNRSWTSNQPAQQPYITFFVGGRGVKDGIDLPMGQVVKFQCRAKMLLIGGPTAAKEKVIIDSADERAEIFSTVDSSLTSYFEAVERRGSRG